MVCAHVFISGDVIGVGFRAWIVANSNELNLTGWVRNVYPRVEAVFEGEKDKVEEMIERCRQGPEVGFVENVEVNWQDYKAEFNGFTILRL
ncbi:acylphosphatase [Candidatus Woesebacteria bacterium]|nr:acylphosphatase [Candidatus Woesebacteria bacterium]